MQIMQYMYIYIHIQVFMLSTYVTWPTKEREIRDWGDEECRQIFPTEPFFVVAAIRAVTRSYKTRSSDPLSKALLVKIGRKEPVDDHPSTLFSRS